MPSLETPKILKSLLLCFSLGLGLGACNVGEPEPAPGLPCDEAGAEAPCATPGEVMLCASAWVPPQYFGDFGSDEDLWSECIPEDYECFPGETGECPGARDEVGNEVIEATCRFGDDGLPYWDESNCYA